MKKMRDDEKLKKKKLALSSRWPFLMIWKSESSHDQIWEPSWSLRVLIFLPHHSNSESSLSHKNMFTRDGDFWISNFKSIQICVEKCWTFLGYWTSSVIFPVNILCWLAFREWETLWICFVASWKKKTENISFDYVASERASIYSCSNWKLILNSHFLCRLYAILYIYSFLCPVN